MNAPFTRWTWAAWALALPGPLVMLVAVAGGPSVLRPLGDPSGVLFFFATVPNLASVGCAAAAFARTRGGVRRGRWLALASIPAALAAGAGGVVAAALSGMPHLG